MIYIYIDMYIVYLYAYVNNYIYNHIYTCLYIYIHIYIEREIYLPMFSSAHRHDPSLLISKLTLASSCVGMVQVVLCRGKMVCVGTSSI